MSNETRSCLYLTEPDSPSQNGESVTVGVTPYRFVNENGEHMHTLRGLPLIGTSTIASEGLPKPGLMWWAAEVAAVTCLEAGARIPTIREEYEAVCKLHGKDKKNARDRLQRKYPIFKKARYAHKEKKEAAAGPGTDMHGALENYVKYCIYEHGGSPMPADGQPFACNAVFRFSEWAIDYVLEFLWSEAHCYSESVWTGGICDCGAVMRESRNIAAFDFKSSQDAFFGQFVQVGGYALQIEENGIVRADGTPIAVDVPQIDELIVFPFGGDGQPKRKKNVEQYKGWFRAAAALYKGTQSFEKEAA